MKKLLKQFTLIPYQEFKLDFRNKVLNGGQDYLLPYQKDLLINKGRFF